LSVVSRIGEAIGEVDDIVSAIAAAVDLQTSATAEISENVTKASTGIAEVNRIAGMIAENSGQVEHQCR
jgi:methyl-accepting chemotaxis protein